MNKEDALEVSEVVNWLLLKYDSSQFKLTNLKLNKLVYFMHGVYLAREDTPLIRNRFECWQRGPVISSLYHRLKRFEQGNVTELISCQNYERGTVDVVSSTRMDERMTVTLAKATNYFVEKSAFWLVEQSHSISGPWFKHYVQDSSPNAGKTIPDYEIKEHFVNVYGGKRLQ